MPSVYQHSPQDPMTFDQELQVQSSSHLVRVASTKPADFLSPRETSFPSSQRAESAERKTSPNEIDHEFVGRKSPFTRQEHWIAFPSKSPFTRSPRARGTPSEFRATFVL